jgi:nucleotide-binding universal stress UspA family protein
MYKRVLLAYDGTLEGRTALREGALLARSLGAEIFLLSVIGAGMGIQMAAAASNNAPMVDMRDTYRQIFEEGVAGLEELGFKSNAKMVEGEPVDQITKYAREISADLVVVGHRRKNIFSRWWSGSTSSYLSDSLTCSLLIGRTEVPREAFQHAMQRIEKEETQ